MPIRLLTLAVLLCLPGALRAGDLLITGSTCLPARAGEAWAECWAEVENAGKEEFRGTLEAELVPYRSSGPVSRLEIAVAPGAKKRFFLLVHAGWGSRAELRFRLLDATGPRATFDATGVYDAAGLPVIVVVAPSGSEPALLMSLPEKLLKTMHVQRRVVESTDRLPEHWQGWTGTAMIALSGTDFRAMSDAQRKAIADWVWMGGRVMLLPGSDPQWLAHPFVQKLAPVGTVSDGKLLEVPGRTYRFEHTGEVVPTKFGFASGFAHGRGEVLVVAFDANHPGLRGASGVEKTGQDLITSLGYATDPYVDYSPASGSYRWRDFCEAMGSGVIDYPPTGGLVLVLLVYIALAGPVNFVMLRKRHMPALTVLTVPALGAATMALLLGAGWILRDTSITANRLTVLRLMPGTDLAQAREHAVVATGRRRTLRISSDAGRLAAMPSGRAEPDRASDYAGEELQRTFEPKEPVWLHALGYERAGVVVAEMDSSRFTLRNESDYDFERAWLVHGDARLYKTLGAIPRGGSSGFEAPFDSDETPWSTLGPDPEDDPLHAILRDMRGTCFEAKSALVIAVVRGARAPLRVGGEPLNLLRDTTVLVIPVEVRK